ncbi:hypothetical protein DOS84_17355 [Flavobacterium aquariorum]|uniref:Uncharacterized protein n=1 Tax=Flavobacterium aquariorum TaxID=2217670 RepID=A0A2W7TPT6_9FLAO|nr:hypothetical protein [Flavobacterium aquariorum]PZX92068.1 hypothetical protein DOS84_17355 [Flavobacterium aquariorum]
MNNLKSEGINLEGFEYGFALISVLKRAEESLKIILEVYDKPKFIYKKLNEIRYTIYKKKAKSSLPINKLLSK